MRLYGTFVATATMLTMLPVGASARDDLTAAAREFFETRIRPVLVGECASCHSGERPQGGLRLDYRGGWERGGKSGTPIERGNVDKSLLIRLIRHESPGMPMPLGGKKLAPEVIAAFEEWVRMGAPDPRDTAATAPPPEQSWDSLLGDRRRWWSLQPVVRPAVPSVKQFRWSKRAVDRFILAKLEARGLVPAPRTELATLLRRLNYVLTGLPPTPEEVDAFVRDRNPAAYLMAVDRLLASPHFGERWARHWMDVIGYSDTYGVEWDIPVKGAWRFRDYLIRAFNADVPFDQLVREQIAGDLIPQPRIDPKEQINESLIGPMFFQMGEKSHNDSLRFNGIHQQMLSSKIDVFSKAFQGTTVACSRCHDHKFEAISQRDYYALAGILMSSRWVTNTLDTPQRNREVLEQLVAIKPKLHPVLADWWFEEADQILRYLLAGQACINSDTDAQKLSEGLDSDRLAATKKALTVSVGVKPPIEDALYPWFELQQAASNSKSLESVWRELAEMYLRTREERIAANARDYTLIADFRHGIPAGWSVDGVGLRQGPVSNGELAVSIDGPYAITRLLSAGLATDGMSPRLNGAVRTPYLNPSGPQRVSLELSGGDFATHRQVVDNAFLTERQVYLTNKSFYWVELSIWEDKQTRDGLTPDEKAEMRIFAEVATKASNPNFPPRVGLGGKLTKEQEHDARSWFSIGRVMLHDKAGPPADELARFANLFSGGTPTDLSAAANRYGDWLATALTDWRQGRADEEDVRLINWMLDSGLLPNKMDARPAVRDLVASYRNAEKQLAEPETVNGMADLDEGRDYRLNIRGVYEDLGERVPRGYLEVLTGRRDGLGTNGSGRLQLADLIASPKNPLTARVFVNRVWHWVFGTGIVATPDDFGHLGEPPSHPEMLDYLADSFVKRGWSLKKLVRMLVTSETFQQSGQISVGGRAADPLNRLLHHYPLRRLDAESVQDYLLWVSTRLNPRLFGDPINPARTKEDPTKRLFSGPVDADGRRSIYVKMTIMDPPKFLATFNQPSPKILTGRRDVTNVPAQALALLNDPFVTAQAEYWARQLIVSPHSTPEERLTAMFRRAFGRAPSTWELTRWTKAVRDMALAYRDSPGLAPKSDEIMQSLPVWKSTAHAIFNTKEFLYVR